MNGDVKIKTSPVSSAPKPKTGVSFAASLKFEDIHHDYNGVTTLCGIDLDVKPGEVLCLLGPSGSGKTTLLRIAAGIEQQNCGRVFLNEREISSPKSSVPPEKRGIGLMFQDFALFPHMTVFENVKFGLTALSASDAKSQAMLSLKRVGLEHYADNYPHALSGGEQQRAALARAIAPRPSVLLMDEPFSGLDSRLKDAVRADTLSVLRDARATAIVVTHDADEAMQMADRIALMRDGALVQVGTAQEIYEHPKTLFAASFFSDLNVFHANVSDGHVKSPIGTFSAKNISDDANVKIAIRPSGFAFHESEGDFPARIVKRRFLGRYEHLLIAVPNHDEPLRASVRTGILSPSATDIMVKINHRDVFVFET